MTVPTTGHSKSDPNMITKEITIFDSEHIYRKQYEMAF